MQLIAKKISSIKKIFGLKITLPSPGILKSDSPQAEPFAKSLFHPKYLGRMTLWKWCKIDATPHFSHPVTYLRVRFNPGTTWYYLEVWKANSALI